MKIQVYKTRNVFAKNIDEEEKFCKIMNLPSLKNGYITVIGELSHTISKSEYNKHNKLNVKLFSLENNEWIEGVYLTSGTQKLFVPNIFSY